MKVGKASELVLNRSVFKQIRHRRDEVILRPQVGVDASAIKVEEDEVITLSTNPVVCDVNKMGRIAVTEAVNNVVCSGATPVGVLTSIIIPIKSGEQTIKRLVHDIEETCVEYNIEILGGHTEYSINVNQPMINITGIGKIYKEAYLNPRKMEPGQEIVMTKWAGLEGTAELATKKAEELKTKYANSFVEQAKELTKYASVSKEAKIAMELGVTAMHDLSEGGIFSGLWEFANAGHVGFQVDLTQIPLKQETIEVCEFFDLNPYMLLSTGSLLCVTSNANQLVEELEKQGIKASVIGKLTQGKERLVVNEDECRYLQPPKFDEIFKVTILGQEENLSKCK